MVYRRATDEFGAPGGGAQRQLYQRAREILLPLGWGVSNQTIGDTQSHYNIQHLYFILDTNKDMANFGICISSSLHFKSIFPNPAQHKQIILM